MRRWAERGSSASVIQTSHNRIESTVPTSVSKSTMPLTSQSAPRAGSLCVDLVGCYFF
jgi:hypothetical protein